MNEARYRPRQDFTATDARHSGHAAYVRRVHYFAGVDAVFAVCTECDNESFYFLHRHGTDR